MIKTMVLVIIGVFLLPGIVSANYKYQTSEDVKKEIINFFNIEKGNRLTGYSIDGLMLRINKVFNDNVVIPKPPKKVNPDGATDEQ